MTHLRAIITVGLQRSIATFLQLPQHNTQILVGITTIAFGKTVTEKYRNYF